MRYDTLHLWHLADPGQPQYVGLLSLVASGKGVSLRYAAQWLQEGFPLSEDLPLIDVEHLPPGRMAGEARAVGAVDDARPDRWGEKVIRFVDRPKRTSLMEYLYYAGDERFGALGVSTSGTSYQPRPGGPLPRLEDAQQLSDVVAKIEAAEPLSALEARIIAGGGSPLGGAKPKALIDINGQEWVIKFFNSEPVDVPLIEHASMTLARLAGITTAETQVLRLREGHALAVRRFDRTSGVRIHSLSAGTAIRAETPAGAEPELGYPSLARVLRRSGVAAEDAHLRDAEELFRRMVFNILIDNTDDHEKNHALLVVHPRDNGRLRLAPAYDVLPTNSGQGFQEFICGTDGQASTLSNAMSQCEAFGMTASQAANEVANAIEVVNGWRAHFAAAGVTTRDCDALAQRLEGEELRLQREQFDASAYGGRAERPKRPRPFGTKGRS